MLSVHSNMSSCSSMASPSAWWVSGSSRQTIPVSWCPSVSRMGHGQKVSALAGETFLRHHRSGGANQYWTPNEICSKSAFSPVSVTAVAYPSFQQGKSEGFDSCDWPSNLNQIEFKSSIFQPLTLQFDGWPKQITWHIFYITYSSVHHLKPLMVFKLELLSGNPQFGSKWTILFVPCDLEICWMTLENNRAPLLCYIKFCASF